MKYFIAVGILAIALFTGYAAFSQENELGDKVPGTCTKYETIVKTLESAGVKTTEVPKSVVDALVTKNGMPPKTVEGFKLYRNDLNHKSQIFTVNPDGCVGWVSPIANEQQLDNFLGITNG